METRVGKHVLLVSKRVSLKTQGVFLVVVPVTDTGAISQGSKRGGHLHSHKPRLTLHWGKTLYALEGSPGL